MHHNFFCKPAMKSGISGRNNRKNSLSNPEKTSALITLCVTPHSKVTVLAVKNIKVT